MNSSKRKYNYNGLLFVDYTLVRSVGLEHILTGYDFGTDVFGMKGFIIDGIVYGDTTLTDIDDNSSSLPTEFKLSQNYPNPFNPSTKISWESPVSGHQSLKVYDVLGNEVATLVNEYNPAGNYEVEFNANSLSSGIYFYRLQAGSFIQTKKMILIK
ncbi:MAG: T9SS type A sorting domain-containing protein [Ignavibacteriales bacterium]|nr:T9SS type A sorting domain-containing protein [Ignavibacteriales bacterium]